jgi:virginiamycin A acetyltransferase
MHGPDPKTLHPLPGYPHAVFLKNLVDLPNVAIGDYSYYDDREGPERFVRHILYHYGFSGDRLVIGKFCAIAKDVSFIMGDANHALEGLTTYPFAIFRQGWEDALPLERYRLPRKGDTTVGNDVWLGTGATVLPGVTIGDGAVVGAKAVVAGPVPPYAIVAGNPARIVRQRFDPAIVARLQRLAWWDWPAERITRAIPALVEGDLEAAERLAAIQS